MRANGRAPTEAFCYPRPPRLRKRRAVDKIELLDYRGRSYPAYDTIKALAQWRSARSSLPETRDRLLQDLQALLEGLLALDEKGNVTVPEPLPPARSQPTLAAIEKQLLKARPVLTAVLRGR